MSHEVRTLDVGDARAIEHCFEVFHELRPHLTPAEFARRVAVQSGEGYRIVSIERQGVVAAAAGYRTQHFLAWGRVLYVDDLVTRPGHTRRGLGGALIDWLIGEARREHCDALHLDSGYARHDAHRLYLDKGLRLACHHFALKLN